MGNRADYLQLIEEARKMLDLMEQTVREPGFNEFNDNAPFDFRCADGEVEMCGQGYPDGHPYHWMIYRHKGDAYGRLRNNT